MEIQSQTLPRFPFTIRTPHDKEAAKFISFFGIISASGFYYGYSNNLISHKFCGYSISLLSFFPISIGLINFAKWNRIARHLPIEELLPYLNGVPERKEEASPQLRTLINQLIHLPRFKECLDRLDKGTAFRVLSLSDPSIQSCKIQLTLLQDALKRDRPQSLQEMKPQAEESGQRLRQLKSSQQLITRRLEEISRSLRQSIELTERHQNIERLALRNDWNGVCFGLSELFQEVEEESLSQLETLLGDLIRLPGFHHCLAQFEPAVRINGWRLLSPEKRANAAESTLEILLWSTSSLKERKAFWNDLTPLQQNSFSHLIEAMDREIAIVKKASQSNRPEDLAPFNELFFSSSRGPLLLNFLSKEERVRIQEKAIASQLFWKNIRKVRTTRCAEPRLVF